MALKLPEVMSGSIIFEKWLIFLAICKINGINEFEKRESKIHWSDHAHCNLKDYY